MKHLPLRPVIVALGCLAAGCDSKGNPTVPTESILPTATVSVEPRDSRIHVGDSIVIQASVTSLLTNLPLSWDTMDTNITIQPQGSSATVKCVAPGPAVVGVQTLYTGKSITGRSDLLCLPFVSVTATPSVLEASHKVASTSCPQPLGTIEIRNPSGLAGRTVQVKVESENPGIDVSAVQASMAPGAGQVLTVTFNCRTAPPIATRIIVTITSSGVADEVSIVAVNVSRS